MKKFLLVFSIMALVLSSCKNDKKENTENTNANEQVATDQKDSSIKIIRGEFIYVDNAAVLKGNNFIYGVVVDSLTKELAKQVEPLKREKYDMVPVIVQGKVEDNPQKDGWDKVVKIEKIVTVTKPTSGPGIKVMGSKKEEGKLKAKK